MAYIYLQRTYDHVPQVGLDNGFYCVEVIGPASKVIFYDKVDKDIEDENYSKTKVKSITIDGITYKHNKKIFNKYGCDRYTVRNTLKSTWYYIADGATKAEKYTQYSSYEGKSWRMQHPTNE